MILFVEVSGGDLKIWWVNFECLVEFLGVGWFFWFVKVDGYFIDCELNKEDCGRDSDD